MLGLYIVLFGFAIAWLRGGRPRTPVVRSQPAIFAAALAQAAGIWLPGPLDRAAILTSYALLGWVLVQNRESLPARVILVGVALNGLVIAANGGRMPVDMDLAAWVGSDTTKLLGGGFFKHVAMTDGTRLRFLGDVIPLAWPLRRAISVGDIFTGAGIFLLVQDLMGRPVTFGARRLLP